MNADQEIGEASDNFISCADVSSDENNEFENSNDGETEYQSECSFNGTRATEDEDNLKENKRVVDLMNFPKKRGACESDVEVDDSLCQTDEISIEELEGIINASPMKGDTSDLDMVGNSEFLKMLRQHSSSYSGTEVRMDGR